MEEELKDLKSALRCVAVSSPTQINMRSLLRDYRNMFGHPLPISKFGYKDPLNFLKERCSDCFLFQGSPVNPDLIVIVTEKMKHIDEHVRKQKISSANKIKGKRRSVQEPPRRGTNLVTETFAPQSLPCNSKPDIVKSTEKKPVKQQDTPKPHINNSEVDKNETKTDSIVTSTPAVGTNSSAYYNFLRRRIPVLESSLRLDDEKSRDDDDSPRPFSDYGASSGTGTSSAPSSSGSGRQAQLDALKAEVKDLVADSRDGVWCSELLKLYRSRYGREMDFGRFGFTTIVGLVASLQDDGDVVLERAGEAGALLLRTSDAAPPRPRPRVASLVAAHRRSDASLRRSARHAYDPDDALPGIDFDPDVFPADCMQYSDSIPLVSIDGIERGSMVEVMVGEVYSPSHFWLIRLGREYNVAMEDLMDRMTAYYTSGEGRDRTLSVGAVREGHYCSSVYEHDWHRSLIVKVVDCETVKVRHVDYGTVETTASAGLKPLLRSWAALPAQAIRARLAGVRPTAGGRRWPHAAALHFLRLVQDRPLVANVVAVDHEERVLEVCLVDTSTERDVRLDQELVRAGHADARADCALATPAESHLCPRFGALESGDTPNLNEIHAYLRDGIDLDYVDDYRRHVPCRLEPLAPLDAASDTPEPALTPAPEPEPPAPSPPPPPPPSPPPPPVEVLNRVPLLRARSSSPRPSRASPAPPPPPGFSQRPQSQPPLLPLPPQPPPPAAMPRFGPMPNAMMPMPPLGPLNMFPPPHLFHPVSPYPPVSQAMYGPPAPPLLRFPCPPRPMGPFRPPPPRAACSPPPPYNGPGAAPPPPPSSGAGVVVLSVSECEIYSLLNRVDPKAAHWYMVDAISRARQAPAGGVVAASAARPLSSTLNPDAAEFRSASVTTQTDLDS